VGLYFTFGKVPFLALPDKKNVPPFIANSASRCYKIMKGFSVGLKKIV
jgi:hypothetical protein